MPRAQGGEEIFPEALAMIRMLGGALFFQAIATVREGAARSSDLALRITLRLAGLEHPRHRAQPDALPPGPEVDDPLFGVPAGGHDPRFRGRACGALRQGEALVEDGASASCSRCRAWSRSSALDRSTGGRSSWRSTASATRPTWCSRATSCSRVGALRSVAWIFTYARDPLRAAGHAADARDAAGADAARVGLRRSTSSRCRRSSRTCSTRGRSARSSATLVTIYIYLQPLHRGAARVGAARARASRRRAWLAAVLDPGGPGRRRVSPEAGRRRASAQLVD